MIRIILFVLRGTFTSVMYSLEKRRYFPNSLAYICITTHRPLFSYVVILSRFRDLKSDGLCYFLNMDFLGHHRNRSVAGSYVSVTSPILPSREIALFLHAVFPDATRRGGQIIYTLKF